MSYINISGYTFTPLTNLAALQASLKSKCQELELKGTILLGSEGMNVFLCGKHAAIEGFSHLLTQLGLPSITFKESPSETVPFKRMWVKIKTNPAPALTPEQFKEWQKNGKDMVVLDARNDYEVRIGKFKNALHLDIQHFRTFPEAAKKLGEELKNKTIVTYCTGGIRCEKAAPFLMANGFKEVYQLQGGILNYLEKCGPEFYEGECFVFDKRIAVDAQLQETHTVQCFVCRQPVTQAQQQSKQYQEGRFCPHCIHSGAILQP
jgi:UPF0176 protein